MALAGPLALRGKTRLLKRPASASRYANPHRPGISWACGLRTQADVIHSKSADRLATNVRRGLASWLLLSACVLGNLLPDPPEQSEPRSAPADGRLGSRCWNCLKSGP